MKIGYVQFAPALGNLNETLERLSPLIQAGKGADLLVLPELSNSGYNFKSRAMAFNLSESASDSVFLDYIIKKCAAYDLHIVVGINERDGDRLFNASFLIGPGGILGKYRKLHLFINEKDYFEPGDLGLPVFDIGSCKVGMVVCFDWIFPETFRILALKGADVICHPSNLVLPGFAQQAIPVHALLNHVFIVTANRIGIEGDLTFTGNSIISNKKGKLLASAPADRDEVKIVEIDAALARDKALTPRNDVFKDRRPGEYQELVKDLDP
ncbi:MAG: nitrilase-related carbon-nitrogen hydrolase [Myxococcota bacterium]|nr:nitrilase-related carbon-nitrogen hydrolase [Myxococcota bacterium]